MLEYKMMNTQNVASQEMLPPTGGEGSITEDPNQAIYTQVDRGREIMEKIHDPAKRELMERVQSAMELVSSNLQELHTLPQADQLHIVEDLTGKVFDEDPEAVANIEKIGQARQEGREEEARGLVSAQKNRYDEIRREVAFNLGVEIEDVEEENREYRDRLIEKVITLDAQTDEEIMKALGFLVEDPETGEVRFNFPQELFPPHIVEKWKHYEKLVKDHKNASAKFSRGTDDNSEEIVQLDLMRRFAHNNLAKTVQEFLQLDSWDLERCRKFVIKMVEKRFPTAETKESQLTSEEVIKRLRVVQGLGKAIQAHHSEETE